MLGERPKTAEELNAELYEKVSAEFEEIFYKVRFESEGVLLFETVYRPGEVLTLPANPTHSNDALYIFAGRSPALQEIVTGDATDTALFH